MDTPENLHGKLWKVMLPPRASRPDPVGFPLLYFQNSGRFLKKENAKSAGDILPLRRQVRAPGPKQHTFPRLSVFTVTCITLAATCLSHKSLITTYKGIHLKRRYDGGPIWQTRNSFPPYKEIQRFLIWCCRSLFGESQHRSVIGCRLSEPLSDWSVRTAHWNKYQNGCASDNVTLDTLQHKNNKTLTFFSSFESPIGRPASYHKPRFPTVFMPLFHHFEDGAGLSD